MRIYAIRYRNKTNNYRLQKTYIKAENDGKAIRKWIDGNDWRSINNIVSVAWVGNA